MSSEHEYDDLHNSEEDKLITKEDNEELLTVPRPRKSYQRIFISSTLTAVGVVFVILYFTITRRTEIIDSLSDMISYERDEVFLRRFESAIVDKYIAWHNKTIQRLVSSSNTSENVKYLVWKGNHGIGDRFRAMMNVLLGTIISERVLFLDWGNSLPVNEILSYGDATNFSYDSRILGNLDNLSGSRSNRATIEDMELLLSSEKIVVSVANSRPDKDYFFHLHKLFPDLEFSKNFASIWRSGLEISDIDFYHLLLSKLIRPTRIFSKIMAGLKSRGLTKHGQEEPAQLNGTYISIHVRYGKGVNEGNLKRFNFSHFGLNVSSISNCLARKAVKMARSFGMKSGRYFLATDTIEIRKTLGDALIHRDKNAEVYYGNWEVKHIQSLSTNSQDDLQGFILTFAELELLSRGLGMVHLYSGFADVAKWMGRIKHSKQVSYKFCADFTHAAMQK